MQLVDRPTVPPGHCIVNLSHEDHGGYVDIGPRQLVDPRVYVSRQAVIDMGRLFRFPTPEEHEEAVAAIESLTKKAEHLAQELAEADKYAEAAEYTLKATFGDDTKIRQKPGRKVKNGA